MNNKVFFIGLGMGGCRIVRDLKKLGYEGIMLDCSNKNRKALEIENENKSVDDYYTMGGTGGTCGERSNGKEFIEKDLWCIQRKLTCLGDMEYVVMISCADSGVSGGEEILIEEINENYPACKIGLINILAKDYYLQSLKQMISASRANDILKEEGKIESYIYIHNDKVIDNIELNGKVVEEVNELFEDKRIDNKLSDFSLKQYIESRETSRFIVGRNRIERVQQLKDELLKLAVEKLKAELDTTQSSMVRLKEKDTNREERSDTMWLDINHTSRALGIMDEMVVNYLEEILK